MKKKQKSKVRKNTAISTRADRHRDLTVRAYSTSISTLDKTTRSIEAVLATETPVLAFDLARWEPIQEILLMDGARIPEQVPLLDSHDRSTIGKIAGSTRDMRVEGPRLIGRNYYAKTGIGADGFDLACDGHLQDNSIGYQINRGGFVMIAPGKSRMVKGRNFTAGAVALRVVTDWTLKENSLTPVGADSNAKNRNDTTVDFGDRKMKLTKKQLAQFKTWLSNRNYAYDDLADEQRDSLAEDFLATLEVRTFSGDAPSMPPVAPPASPVQVTAAAAAQDAAIRKQAVDDELARQRAIRDLAGEDIPAEVVQECIDEQRSVEDCQRIFLQSIRTNRASIGSPAIISVNREGTINELAAGILIRQGWGEFAFKEYGEQTAERGELFRDLTMMDLCIRALAMDGVQVPHNREEIIGRAFATMTLPQLLGAVANKSALKGYNSAPATWLKWCAIGSAKDFKTMTKVRLTDSGELEEVNNAGEIPAGTAVEEYEQYNIATYGKIFSITRKNIINDDLDAFTRTPQRMGRAASLRVSKLVYTHLMANGNMQDGTALFHADHSNLNTSTALGHAGLTTAIQNFRKQTDIAGNEVDIEPKNLLVPPDLEVLALELMTSDNLIATGVGSSAVRAARKNVLKGRLEVISETRLSNSNYTGYSTSTWYVTAAPGDVDTVEVSFLNGRNAPTIERLPAPADVLGIIYRVYIDPGVKALDHRGLSQNEA